MKSLPQKELTMGRGDVGDNLGAHKIVLLKSKKQDRRNQNFSMLASMYLQSRLMDILDSRIGVNL